jgi:uncharacterized protein (DUF486 family)
MEFITVARARRARAPLAVVLPTIPPVRTALLLICSNVFMTFAWYGHLTREKFKAAPLWIVVVGSWAIALFEYCFQVPANRMGAESGYTAAQLKIMQEVITLGVFVGFSLVFFRDERITWNIWVGFALVLLAVFFVYHKW